ncbi:Rnp2-like_domain superfamily [Hexamita inflata]|uniref:Rnp2-like domain superfamily n=1 Tax=Hexamita inflata TaxID=28002 RepID=A0AA86P750_9EUKA|nr:Rnp2-like domain superfamily [Hexamita inflata]
MVRTKHRYATLNLNEPVEYDQIKQLFQSVLQTYGGLYLAGINSSFHLIKITEKRYLISVLHKEFEQIRAKILPIMCEQLKAQGAVIQHISGSIFQSQKHIVKSQQ